MKLVVEQGELAGQEFLLERPVIVVGRGRDSDLILPAHGVSRQHARLQRGPQGWMLTDLGSTNGTLVNGQRIAAHEAHPLRPGDRVAMGSLVFALQRVEVAEAPRPPQARPKRRPHPALLIVGAVALVAVLAGIVALLVMLLQPKETISTPTPIDQMEQVMTVVPTEFQEFVPPILTLVPTGLPFLPPGATPTPESMIPGARIASLVSAPPAGRASEPPAPARPPP